MYLNEEFSTSTVKFLEYYSRLISMPKGMGYGSMLRVSHLLFFGRKQLSDKNFEKGISKFFGCSNNMFEQLPEPVVLDNTGRDSMH